MSRNWHSFINFIAFASLAFIGIVLILTKLGLGGDVNNALNLIAMILAYVTVAFCAFIFAYQRWAKSKNNIWYMIVWVVAVTLIVLAYVI
jgi:hypothetical protein